MALFEWACDAFQPLQATLQVRSRFGYRLRSWGGYQVEEMGTAETWRNVNLGALMRAAGE